MGKQGGGAAA